MIAEPIAVRMAAQSVHRHVHEPQRERRSASRRGRAIARVLHALAVRLDPAVRAPRSI